MKVINLLQSGHFSGAENVVCQIIEMFRNEKDIEMLYCSCDGKIREVLNEWNIPFISIKEVRRIINVYKPDIIHTHDMRTSFVAVIASNYISLICHIHLFTTF